VWSPAYASLLPSVAGSNPSPDMLLLLSPGSSEGPGGSSAGATCTSRSTCAERSAKCACMTQQQQQHNRCTSGQITHSLSSAAITHCSQAVVLYEVCLLLYLSLLHSTHTHPPCPTTSSTQYLGRLNPASLHGVFIFGHNESQASQQYGTRYPGTPPPPLLPLSPPAALTSPLPNTHTCMVSSSLAIVSARQVSMMPQGTQADTDRLKAPARPS
jgi:hypothetical protein